MLYNANSTIYMGVTGLWSFLRKHADVALQPLNPSHLHGHKIAIDAGMLFTTALKVSITDDPEEKWRPVFINMVIRKVQWVINAGATPIIILDGIAPAVKKHAHDKRAIARSNAVNQLTAARIEGDKTAILKALRNAARLTREMETAVTDSLVEAGIEVIRAPGEAEVECARMSLDNEVWGVATEDGDALICGARRVLRGICSACPNGGTLVTRDQVLKVLDLTPEQMRWMAVLAGTDFHPGLKGVGCARARKLVQPYANPTDNLHEIVKEVQLHEGLCMAAMQFGDWSTTGDVHPDMPHECHEPLQKKIRIDAEGTPIGNTEENFHGACIEFTL